MIAFTIMHPFMLFCKKQEIRMDTVSIHTVYVAITDFPEFCLWLRRALKATYGMFSRGKRIRKICCNRFPETVY